MHCFLHILAVLALVCALFRWSPRETRFTSGLPMTEGGHALGVPTCPCLRKYQESWWKTRKLPRSHSFIAVSSTFLHKVGDSAKILTAQAFHPPFVLTVFLTPKRYLSGFVPCTARTAVLVCFMNGG